MDPAYGTPNISAADNVALINNLGLLSNCTILSFMFFMNVLKS